MSGPVYTLNQVREAIWRAQYVQGFRWDWETDDTWTAGAMIEAVLRELVTPTPETAPVLVGAERPS